MQIRTTEREHYFTSVLFKKLNLFSVQGLTLDVGKKFSAVIEAIQYESFEDVILMDVFPNIELNAKYYLANALNIPFYMVVFKEKVFSIYKVSKSEDFIFELVEEFDDSGFVLWWAKLKGLSQPKPLYEAADRVKNSIFDNTLEKSGMAWGGNIDGFMFRNKKFACIIENIYTQKNPLESVYGEPSVYFHKRGPNYNTWFPTVKLAKQLNIPLLLFTIEGKNNRDRIGFAIIDYLSKDGIFYSTPKPNKNIIEGLSNIEDTINESLSHPCPRIV